MSQAKSRTPMLSKREGDIEVIEHFTDGIRKRPLEEDEEGLLQIEQGLESKRLKAVTNSTIIVQNILDVVIKDNFSKINSLENIVENVSGGRIDINAGTLLPPIGKAVGLKKQLSRQIEREGNASKSLIEKHKEALQHYCRKCGRRLHKDMLKPNPFVKICMPGGNFIDFASESSDVYPTQCCISCICKVKSVSKNQNSSGLTFLFHKFQPHNEKCVICSNEKVMSISRKDSNVTSFSLDSAGGRQIEGLGNVLASNDTQGQNSTTELSAYMKSILGNSRVNFEAKKETKMLVEHSNDAQGNCSRSSEQTESSFEHTDMTEVLPRNSIAKVSCTKLVEKDKVRDKPLEEKDKSCFVLDGGIETVEKPSDGVDPSHKGLKRVKLYCGPTATQAGTEDSSASRPQVDVAADTQNGRKKKGSGIPLAQVTASQRKIAQVLSCKECDSIPFVPYVSKCSHVYCKMCVENIVNFHVCSQTGKVLYLNRRDFYADTSGVYKGLVNSFIFKCKNICNFEGNVEELLIHQRFCTDEMIGDGEREMREKIEDFLEIGDKYCEANNMSLEFLLFCSLRRFLKLKGDKRRVALLMSLWEEKGDLEWQLSPEDCLALKVALGQRQELYRYHYNFLKKHVSVSNLRSPKQIEQMEKMFYPPFTDFSVESQEGISLYKRTICEEVEPAELGELMSCRGFRWKFTAAVAKTLQELSFEFQDRLTSSCNAKFVVNVCDKYEKVGNLRMSNLRKTMKVPNHFIRYSFCISTISLIEDDEESILYSSEKANSSVYRPTAVALPSEQVEDNVKLLLHPIEEEKRNLSGKLLCVRLPNGRTGKFCLRLSSVINYGNEPLDLVSLGNFDINEYGKFCILCHSNQMNWLEHLGSCTIQENAKSSSSNNLVNPLQFDLNFIKLFNEVMAREISQVYITLNKCNSEEKSLLRVSMAEMNAFLLQKFSIEPDSLILEPEEYVKKFYAAWHQGGGAELISSKIKQADVCGLFWRYFELRTIYTNALDKTKVYKEFKVQSFKTKALHWIKFAWRRFPYIAPSSYLHLLVEHLEELLEVAHAPATVSVDKEANALNPQVKSLLVDTLKNQWLKTSPFLKKKGSCSRKAARCDKCGERGHTPETCQSNTSP